MKVRLLDHLVCPLDRTPLELLEWESDRRSLTADDVARARRQGIEVASLEHEITTGVLINRERKLFYPIHAGVPAMLVFRTGVGDRFQDSHADRLRRELPGFSLPQQPSMPGERDVLRTFSSEWVNYDWDAQTYWNLDKETWFRAMAFLLDLQRRRLDGKLCLEVGIGIGGVADFVSREHGCEMIGVDLGYAVDAAKKHFGRNPFLHVVQASAFAPPFRNATFDFVYSFGVLHHTFSTKTAFESVAELPGVGGDLFIWVYSPQDENRTLLRRSLMMVERMARPVLWRLPEKLQTIALLPTVPLYMAMQEFRRLRGQPGIVRYGFREAIHAARDRLTPPFVHRHTEEEVGSWFEQAGYGDIVVGSRRDRPDYVPTSMMTCTGVGAVRKN